MLCPAVLGTLQHPLQPSVPNYGCLECDRETSSAQLENSAARKYLCRSRVKLAARTAVQLVLLWQVGRKPVRTTSAHIGGDRTRSRAVYVDGIICAYARAPALCSCKKLLAAPGGTTLAACNGLRERVYYPHLATTISYNNKRFSMATEALKVSAGWQLGGDLQVRHLGAGVRGDRPAAVPGAVRCGDGPAERYDFLLALIGAACCKPPSLKVSACLARHSLLPRLPAAPSFDLAEVLHISPKNLWTISDSSCVSWLMQSFGIKSV